MVLKVRPLTKSCMHFVFSLYVTNGQVNHEEKYAQEHNPLESGLQAEEIDISNFETTIIVISIRRSTTLVRNLKQLTHKYLVHFCQNTTRDHILNSGRAISSL